MTWDEYMVGYVCANVRKTTKDWVSETVSQISQIKMFTYVVALFSLES